MNNEILQNLWLFCLIGGIIFVAVLVSMQISIARLKQKNYFLNRDRERYAETLYASQDGYFSFVYPDERIRDPRRGVRERCSRRLAVMLNLKNGTQSGFSDVLEVFYKNDAQKISKYVALMQEEGIGFEDIFALKNNGRSFQVAGARINGQDGNLYCDMIWFRDLSAEVRKNQALEIEKQELQNKVSLLEKILDSLICPVWLRNESLELTAANRAYLELIGNPETDSAFDKPQITDITGTVTAQKAVRANKTQKSPFNLVSNGKAVAYEVVETPCHFKDDLEKYGTVGFLSDVSELVEMKRDFKIHQTAHLDVLSALGTAFAIFDTRQKLIFYNKAFLNLWNLNAAFLESTPLYGAFLDEIRDSRLLPEVSDYKQYKSEEEQLFNGLISAKETLMHIPDGRTFKRMVAPYPNGLIFAYEDVSDRLAATRMINQLVSVQQNILDKIPDAVIVFNADQQLQYCNKSYQKLWKINEVQLQNVSALEDVLEMQRPLLNIAASWNDVKQSMVKHIVSLGESFVIEQSNGTVLEAVPSVLSDDSVMIAYNKVV